MWCTDDLVFISINSLILDRINGRYIVERLLLEWEFFVRVEIILSTLDHFDHFLEVPRFASFTLNETEYNEAVIDTMLALWVEFLHERSSEDSRV